MTKRKTLLTVAVLVFALFTTSSIEAQYDYSSSELRVKPLSTTELPVLDQTNSDLRSVDDYDYIKPVQVLNPDTFKRETLVSEYDPNEAIRSANTPATKEALHQPITFDSKKAERFVNSPCFKTLGFRPWADLQEEERRYKECEEAHRKRNMKNSFGIGLGILLVGGFGGAIIYYSKKSRGMKA